MNSCSSCGNAVPEDAPSVRDAIAPTDASLLDPSGRDTFEYFLSRAHVHGLRGELAERRAAIASALAVLKRRGTPPNEERYAHKYVGVDAFALGELDEG